MDYPYWILWSDIRSVEIATLALGSAGIIWFGIGSVWPMLIGSACI